MKGCKNRQIMIKLIRIDDRFLHGQVAFTWVPSLGVDCILIANDTVASDDFQKMTLGLAKPAGIKLLIRSTEDAIFFLKDEKNKSNRILTLINSVKDAGLLCEAIAEIRSVNFGGLRSREGARLVSKAVHLTEEDTATCRELLKKGIELEVRQVPTDTKQYIQDLINK
jgi:fructoselysine/glucoselysine PTS system EIIB component